MYYYKIIYVIYYFYKKKGSKKVMLRKEFNNILYIEIHFVKNIYKKSIDAANIIII